MPEDWIFVAEQFVTRVLSSHVTSFDLYLDKTGGRKLVMLDPRINSTEFNELLL